MLDFTLCTPCTMTRCTILGCCGECSNSIARLHANKQYKQTPCPLSCKQVVTLTKTHLCLFISITSQIRPSKRQCILIDLRLLNNNAHRYDPSKLQFMETQEVPLAPAAASVGLDIRVVGNDSGEKVRLCLVGVCVQCSAV